ncbi:nitroreductase family deazaflavin-dependent oxidoreductase [Nocardioides bruguierae]|uniref:Nitroreductase family deazaflavin-dependent oxidoreductase n=1 Tax=Nocardioides bruguierae TaxID=2945102 RepID=A0A9X2D6P8_9ACTN|nr:nitroreductase family deazaflavin-dependent oxidoreductase [Nocardioides bruguierae]MCM0620321.1 nitroreductase family deazaflavin-dependent oxidoreductase [Nocardioides bruguierae]
MASNPVARLLRTRWAVRAPIPLFRHGLGFLLGPRMLMLEHVGRTSGEPRYAVLEVVEREDDDHLLVASGLGRRSQWFRNLTATPACHVSTGRRRRVPATAAELSPTDRDAALARYAARNPRAWHALESGMQRLADERGEALDIPLVRLSLAP